MRLWFKSALGALLISMVPAVAEKDAKEKIGADEIDQDAGKIPIAIPIGEPVKGLHLPFYNLTGKLRMQFDAEVANRTSDNIVELKTLKIETFDDQGARDMLVSFPKAVYDLSSSVIKSDESVEVRRNDFVLTGVGMEFDTKKRSGRVFSKIRMEIFNRPVETTTPTPNGP